MFVKALILKDMRFPPFKISPKQYRIATWVFAALFLLMGSAGAIAYSKREAMLKRAIDKATRKAEADYGLKLSIEGSRFSGLSTVRMSHISAVPLERDTLLEVKDLTVGVKIWPLIFGNIKLSEIKLEKGDLKIVLKDSLSNLDFLLKRKKQDTTTSSKAGLNLGELANRLVNEALYKIPDDMGIHQFRISVNDNDTASLRLLTTSATIVNGQLQSSIEVNEKEAIWHVNGKLRPARNQLDIRWFAENQRVTLPVYLQHKLKCQLSFDTVRTEMKEATYGGGTFRISGSWAIKNLSLLEERVSPTMVVVPDARIEADMLVGKNYVSLDSSSTVYLKKAHIHPYIKYTLFPHKIYELKLRAAEQDAQEVLESFPQGLFESLEGMKVSGKIKYDLDFYMDTSIPDSVRFNSTLRPENFKILQWGKTNLQKINHDFIYTPYEYGKPMRDILIGPSNPNFTALGDISFNFRNAVLTSEDPSFFRHRGFVEESIRRSIAVNYKEGDFKRGGSTISMQLVKNAFLNRRKTLARKVEEIFIVWMIENNRLISKERMLEVYFNIIEMGQNVYGIGEASRHYFGKLPSDLTVGESIYLANIIPRPKASLYKFDSDGGLKAYLLPYFNFIGNTMARRGLVPSDTLGYGFYDVRLRENLRRFLQPDNLPIDTADAYFDSEGMILPHGMEDASKRLFDRMFSPQRRDSVQAALPQDTTKTRKELRQERREQRRKEKNKTD